MSTEGSKYVNKEIKNALKEVKQIKTQIEQTNEERKLLLSSLEEAKKKKEVRKSLAAPTLILSAGGGAWGSTARLPWRPLVFPSRLCQLIPRAVVNK